jgi:hypothetical protein
LRGATVAVDGRKVARLALAICVASLAVTAVALFVVGAHKNAEIDGLKQHGIAVSDKVADCRGLLGGSGSNGAGFSCWGTYTLEGHTYTEDIPGTTFRQPGSVVSMIADTSDPGLISTPGAVRRERASDGVYIVPAALLLALAVLLGLIFARRRRHELLTRASRL